MLVSSGICEAQEVGYQLSSRIDGDRLLIKSQGEEGLIRINRQYLSGQWRTVFLKPGVSMTVLSSDDSGVSRIELTGKELSESEIARWAKGLARIARDKCATNEPTITSEKPAG